MALSLVVSIIGMGINITGASLYITALLAIIEICINRMAILAEGLYRHYCSISEAHMLLYLRIMNADNSSNAAELRAESFELLNHYSSFDTVQTKIEPVA